MSLKMKKIIYGLLMIVGGLLITSNFMVNSSEIDHKMVSASGTTCKWISESGYGLGPRYVIPTKIDNLKFSYDSSNSRVRMASLPAYATFYLLPCSTVNSGVSKDGFKIYDSSGNPYNNEIVAGDYENNNKYVLLYYVDVTASSSDLNVYWANVKNGQFDLVRIEKNDSYYYFYDSYANRELEVSGVEEYKKIFSKYTSYYINYSDGMKTWLSDYPTDINDDGEWTFTCVCAEY